MISRTILAAVVFLSIHSAQASQFEEYRGIIRLTPSGAALDLFNDGTRVELSGVDASLAKRHNGQIATVRGSLAIPTGEDERPVLYVDEITVSAPRIRRMNDYTPPSTSGERAADAIKILPFL